MFCEKCGTKNEQGAKFCEKCGHKFEVNQSAFKDLKEKYNRLPKKTKIIMGSVIIIVILAIVFLSILLNNPVKKVRDDLDSYYNNYSSNNYQELVDIERILENNLNNPQVLSEIKQTVKEETTNWVKNFNTSYKDKSSLNQAYKKVNNALSSIHEYYSDIGYILDTDLYNDLTSELKSLYSSKNNYLYGVNETDEYTKYAYYERVIEEDSYYKSAQSYISDYVKNEFTNFKDEIAKLLVDEKTLDDSQKLEVYLKVLDYIKNHTVINNIDLSNTKEYNEELTNYQEKTLKLLNEVIEAKKKDLEYPAIIKLVENVKTYFSEDDKHTKELDDLIKEYTKILPDKLVEKFVVDYLHSNDSSYSTTINEKTYENYLYFSFDGETASRIYRLNKKYKTLKSTIVVGPDWPGSFSGKIVISNGKEILYESPKITKESKDIAITVDITDIDDLKFEFITKDKSENNKYFYIYLTEPYLYK